MIFALANAFILALLLSFSHGILKWISVQQGTTQIEAMFSYWWLLLLAISVYVAIFFYYAYILRFTAISVLHPAYTGLSIVFIFVLGVWAFSEPCNLSQVAGCVLIIVGIFLVSGISG